jgi:diguanylate cyclase (GGDEF)-like protein
MEHDSADGGDSSAKLPSLGALLARSSEPYAGSDIALARRAALAMWTFCTVAVMVLEIFFPPTKAFGNLGWLLAAAEFVGAFAIIRVLANKRKEVGYDFLYVIGYLGALVLALIEHSAGGRNAPYHELFMFLLLGAALMHPPYRVLAFLVFLSAAMFAPAVYAPETVQGGEIITELVLWTTLSVVLMALMKTIRTQRVDLRQEGEDARQLARVDSLTGLGNRRAFDEALDAELARARRSSTPLSLIVADLNGFKEINDRFGHVLGDDCLRQAAAALRGAVRRPDLCFRWGGDEFTILLTGVDATVSRSLAVRLENAVSEHCHTPDGEAVTITCGNAVLDPEMSAADALARSDATLMALKGHGRVTTVAAVDAPILPN